MGEPRTGTINMLLDRVAFMIAGWLTAIRHRAVRYTMRRYPRIDPSVKLGPEVRLIGPPSAIAIGEGSYINDAMIVADDDARVIIGRRCAIGYRVSIKAVTHDKNVPCPDSQGQVRTQGSDIAIGDDCWIGDNVFIREGVTLGNNVVVGANAVVTRSMPDHVVVGGVPATVLRHLLPR